MESEKLRPVSVVRLSTGYWHVRFNANQFVQWPVGREATADDAFGWYPERQAEAANEAVRSHEPTLAEAAREAMPILKPIDSADAQEAWISLSLALASHEARKVVAWRCRRCLWTTRWSRFERGQETAQQKHDNRGTCRATVRALVEE